MRAATILILLCKSIQTKINVNQIYNKLYAILVIILYAINLKEKKNRKKHYLYSCHVYSKHLLFTQYIIKCVL